MLFVSGDIRRCTGSVSSGRRFATPSACSCDVTVTKVTFALTTGDGESKTTYWYTDLATV